MGNVQSVDPRHARIWKNLSELSSDASRVKMLDTLFSAPEYVHAAKTAGVYSAVLGYIGAVRRGEYATWPTAAYAPTAYPQAQQAPTNTMDYASPAAQRQKQLAMLPPPKRALDVLHESYRVLRLDDTKPLTHESLRAAYKRAGRDAHPDKGGSEEAFDSVNRAYKYLEEVLKKLVPSSPVDFNDPRLSAPVTAEAAMKARALPVTPAGALTDKPPVTLNPKKLDMNVFNQLFEENRLPEPDKDDGYGDWLKSQETTGGISSTALRGKYNKDMFNKVFEDEARRVGTSSALAKYQTPSELVSAPTFGTELGSDKPSEYTKAPSGNGIAYTDLKHAYGDGATFSQYVGGVDTSGRPKNLEEAKRMYESAPTPLSAEESNMLGAVEKAREAAELARRTRMATRDVDAETHYSRLQKRLMISQ